MFEYEEALFRLGHLPGESLPDIACRMLEAGVESRAVLDLAGLDRPTLRDAGALFEDAIGALDRAPLTREAAVAHLREHALWQIATGAIEPYAGAKAVHAVWHDLGCPVDLAIFVGLEDEYEDHPRERAAISREIVESARRILSGRKPERAV